MSEMNKMSDVVESIEYAREDAVASIEYARDVLFDALCILEKEASDEDKVAAMKVFEALHEITLAYRYVFEQTVAALDAAPPTKMVQ
jgi:hypothetical protein